MFRGHCHRAQDSKGRLIIPPEFREEIISNSPDGKLVLTNHDDCIFGYPLPEWESIEQSFARMNMSDRRFRNFHRFFVGGAVEVTLDKQGRVLIPAHLRSYAELEKDVVLVGVGRKFEIWAKSRFEEQRRQMEANSDDLMDNLAEAGIELHI